MGPNNLQNFPVDLAVVGKTLTGESCPFCLVEVFVTDTPPDPSGHGEGMIFVGDVVADGSGDFSINVTDEAPCGLGTGVLTTTATPTDDVGDRFAGSTSEFSENEPSFPGSAPCETATPTATDTPTVTETPTQGPPTDTPAAVATTTPPTPATATPTATASKVCGDVDMDTFVNSVDASLVLQLKVGLITTVPNPSNADVDADTFITSVDAALILQADIGIIGVGDLTCL